MVSAIFLVRLCWSFMMSWKNIFCLSFCHEMFWIIIPWWVKWRVSSHKVRCIINRWKHRFFPCGLKLQLIMQWSTGIFVLVLCLLRRNQFNADIALKLGSSFSLIPFVIVVVSYLLIQLIFPYLTWKQDLKVSSVSCRVSVQY